MKIEAVVVELPVLSIFSDPKIDNLGRLVNQYLPTYPLKMIIKIPLVVYPKVISERNEESKELPNLSWKTFQKFKKL